MNLQPILIELLLICKLAQVVTLYWLASRIKTNVNLFLAFVLKQSAARLYTEHGAAPKAKTNCKGMEIHKALPVQGQAAAVQANLAPSHF